ncbi:ATP-grasp fold amidoligase family protein [Pseudokineococcus sp. 5B2Z-1]|uniref:ATP-grasp fold amidoligase family protein n=1 Tax=Pseudokineococcus sp. 5B2Z-1 TaxID=3132744 RepID=UPI003095EAAC
MRSHLRRLPALVRRRLSPSAPVPRPSFLAQREALRRTRALGHELGVRDPVFEVNSKLESRAWADRLGVRQAELLAHVNDVDQVPWSRLPGRFVVKPVHGAGSRGVHLLERAGDGLRDVRRDRPTSVEEVVADLRRSAAEGVVSAEVLVEELVADPQRPGAGPVDWKCSTFFGVVGVVEAKVAGRDGEPRWRLFDADWRDLGRGWRDEQPLAAGLRPPAHAAAVVDLARRVSACVPRPFVRIDLYDGEDGPVFGEITPEPGGPTGFRADVDEHLGRLWEEAEARLMVRGAAAGLLSPADAPLPESALLLERRPVATTTGALAR